MKWSVKCCSEISNESKIANDLNVKVGRDFDASENSLGKMLQVATGVINQKGASSNLKCESLLRECTGIGGD